MWGRLWTDVFCGGCRAKPQSLFAKMGAGKQSEGLGGKANEGKGVGNEGGP